MIPSSSDIDNMPENPQPQESKTQKFARKTTQIARQTTRIAQD